MALFAAFGSDSAGAATAPWKQSDYQNFSDLVTACWKSPTLLKKYNATPAAVLTQYHITLPAGTPAPVIPPKPASSFGKATTSSKAWAKTRQASYSNWDVTVTKASGSTAAVATLACLGCPISTFSSLSNAK